MPVETTGTVISKETSQKVLSMMESVVSEGTGKNARVAGYRIGGKTGTSEDGVNTNKYVTSFCGVAPIDDPQVVVLVTLYNPTGEGGHQGGGVAAPVGGQIFSEVLPYLEVNQGNEEEVEIKEEVVTPDVLGKTLEEANKILKDYMLKGYAINQKRLEYLEKTIKLIDIANRIDERLEGNDAKEILKVIGGYSKALDLLDDYDHRTLKKIEGNVDDRKIEYQECINIINKLRFNEESSLFAVERDKGLESIIGNIYQSFARTRYL